MTLKRRIPYVIHGFALLHALVAVLCIVGGSEDSLLLTLLTMAMTVIICMMHSLSVEFTAISVILVNIAGYVLGTDGANILSRVWSSPMAIHACATFLTTEILGWGLHFLAKAFRREPEAPEEVRGSWKRNAPWLLFAFVTVFLLRVAVDIVFHTDLYTGVSISSLMGEFLENSLLIIVMAGVTLLFIRWAGHASGGLTSFVMMLGFILAVSAAAALLHGFGLPLHFHSGLTFRTFLQILVFSILSEVTIYAILYMIDSVFRMRAEVRKEREKSRQAEFQYMILKHQVNPHFLFNSLNTLDSLVQEGDRESTGEFIHKLAGIYRYMLQHEGESLVRLGDELVFASMYAELMKVRFQDSFRVTVDIPEEDKNRQVIPCSVQLLLENILKHNVLSKDNPLEIRIFSNGKEITVENPLIPKLSHGPSTGLGQKYIRRQVKDLSGSDLRVETSGGKYSVSMPLI